MTLITCGYSKTLLCSFVGKDCSITGSIEIVYKDAVVMHFSKVWVAQLRIAFKPIYHCFSKRRGKKTVSQGNLLEDWS